MGVLAPPKARGASTVGAKVSVFATFQTALAVARLRAAYKLPKWPKWFPVVWKTASPRIRLLVTQPDRQRFGEVLQLVQGPVGGSVVYAIFCHAGIRICWQGERDQTAVQF